MTKNLLTKSTANSPHIYNSSSQLHPDSSKQRLPEEAATCVALYYSFALSDEASDELEAASVDGDVGLGSSLLQLLYTIHLNQVHSDFSSMAVSFFS